MKEYSNYTLTDLKVMTNKEFEKYVRLEYNMFLSDLKHEGDYMTYNEYYREMIAIMDRQDKDSIFNY
jgi:hypothetical protein